MRGTVDAPQLLADITALRWQELTIARVNVKGDVKSTDQIGGNLDVRVDRISQPGVNISRCSSMPKVQRNSMSCGYACRAIRFRPAGAGR